MAQAAGLVAAKTLAFVLALILPLLLVRQLDVAGFGLYKQAFLVVGSAVTLLPMSFAMSAFYFWPRERRRREALVLNVLLVHAVTSGGACVVLVAWPQLLAAVFHGSELSAYGPALGLVVLLWGTSSCLELVAIANGEARLAAGFVLAFQLGRVSLLAAAAVLSPTLAALIGAALVQGLLQVGVAVHYLASRFPRFWQRFDAGLLRAQLAFAVPHGLAAWLYWVHLELHGYVVAHRFDAATYAIYAVGCFQIPLVGILCESAGSVTIPRVSRLATEGRTREIVALSAKLMRSLAAVFLPFYAFFLVMRHEIIEVLFTERYLSSAPVFAIHLTLVPLAVLATPGDAVMRAYADCRFFLLRLRSALALLTLAALWSATERFGSVGAVSVVASVALLDRCAVTLKAGSRLGAGRRDLLLFGDPAKLGLASLAAGLVAATLREALAAAPALPTLLACGLGFGAVYLPLAA